MLVSNSAEWMHEGSPSKSNELPGMVDGFTLVHYGSP